MHLCGNRRENVLKLALHHVACGIPHAHVKCLTVNGGMNSTPTVTQVWTPTGHMPQTQYAVGSTPTTSGLNGCSYP
jgi:hypothetical protein